MKHIIFSHTALLFAPLAPHTLITFWNSITNPTRPMLVCILRFCLVLLLTLPAHAQQDVPLTADETRTFMRELCDTAVNHHMKRDDSPQRGMMYEYLWWKKRGQPGQFIQGEALDTMHDGAWFANAMVNAHRATGDPHYRQVLVEWQLPFYLKMLNHGAELFSTDAVDVREEMRDTWKSSKEWLLQGRENGFVPYWWDDGTSVSLEMLGKKTERPAFPCTNHFAGQTNPEFRLSGWSHGSSNHLAQDLAILLQQAWLMLRDSGDAHDQNLAAECALAARNLQECRARHGNSGILGVAAACALTNADTELMKRVPNFEKETPSTFQNHFTRAVRDFKPGQKVSTPGFADDAMYFYHAGVAKHGTLTRPLALELAFDAFTQPLLWQIYRDDGPVPPGMNRFDLTTLNFVDGRPEHLASQKKGPSGRPLPTGSRMGPQNMAVCGWVMQAMEKGGEFAGIPEQVRAKVEEITGKPCPHPDVKAWLERELGAGLRTWRGIFREHGHIPTGIGCQSVLPGVSWDEFSDTGGYAHLITAASMWLMVLEGKTDWELQIGRFVPPPIPSQVRWEKQMLHYGAIHLQQMEKAIADPKADATIGANFYDRVRLLYGMADYTKDEKWAKAAAELAVAYRDKYVLPNKGNVQPWYLAPDGLAEHFKRTGDVKSKKAVLLLSQTMWAAESQPKEWSEGTARSREVAHSLRALMRAEVLGGPPRGRTQLLVTQALGHIDQWCSDQPDHVVPSFMAGLTMESLIQWYEKTQDPRVPPAVRKMTDWLWAHNWVPEVKAFKYYSVDTTSVSKGGKFPDDNSYANQGGPKPVPDLNMFIGPAFAWLYHQEGRATDRDRADQCLTGAIDGKPDGIEAAWLEGPKQFNQVYTWSFDFMKWRLSRPKSMSK